MLLLFSLCLVWGCSDARGRFEDFQARAARVADAGRDADADDLSDGGPCAPPEPGSISGPALLALDTNLIPGKPVLFLGTIDTPSAQGTTAVHFIYHAVDSQDRRTLVGEALDVGPYPLVNGELDASIPRTTLDGRADPQLYGAALDSSMTLHGQICGVKTFYCGSLEGEAYDLVSGPFTGHFGITLLPSLDAVPARPRFGCDASDIAAALPTTL